MIALALLPFLDRAPTSALRHRWLVLAIAALVFIAIVAFGVYGWAVTPAAHLME